MPLSRSRRFGGADSMALMLLVKRWGARRTGALEVVVATVDHGLRREARAEAEWVVDEARALGLEAHLLTWGGEKPQTGIQDVARAARYGLLAELADRADAKPAAIVTAHTEDDQAETLLMRLARGSGLDGLAAMTGERAADRNLQDVMLVRPLLGISGARLKATLRAANRTWIEDPSNDAERFERVRVRKARRPLAGLGLTNDKMALSARRLARARDALEACTDDLQRDARLDLNAGVYASFDADVWAGAPEELRLRLLARLIRAFGGQSEPLNLTQLEALAERMSQGGFEGATLAGAVLAPRGPAIHVQREWGRARLPTLLLAPGASAVWGSPVSRRVGGAEPGASRGACTGAGGLRSTAAATRNAASAARQRGCDTAGFPPRWRTPVCSGTCGPA
ncbi:MAG: tRNA lysidine(34) synthetase TilS [Hyphomicrobium sp.]